MIIQNLVTKQGRNSLAPHLNPLHHRRLIHRKTVSANHPLLGNCCGKAIFQNLVSAMNWNSQHTHPSDRIFIPSFGCSRLNTRADKMVSIPTTKKVYLKAL